LPRRERQIPNGPFVEMAREIAGTELCLVAELKWAVCSVRRRCRVDARVGAHGLNAFQFTIDKNPDKIICLGDGQVIPLVLEPLNAGENLRTAVMHAELVTAPIRVVSVVLDAEARIVRRTEIEDIAG